MEYRLYEDYQKRKQDLDNFFKKEYEDTRTNNTITKMNEVLDFLTLKVTKKNKKYFFIIRLEKPLFQKFNKK